MSESAKYCQFMNALDEAMSRLEATARLIQSGKTAIMPDGRIVERGTPGAMDYGSGTGSTRPCPKGCGHWFDVEALGRHGCPNCEGEGIERPPITVLMFKPRFEAPILAGTKHHTVRPPRKRPIPTAALLSLRVWTGAPYRTPQREFLMTPLLRVRPIEITTRGVSIGYPGSDRIGWSEGSDGLEAFARADGFDSWEEMRAWFDTEHGLTQPFKGELIRWKESQ